MAEKAEKAGKAEKDALAEMTDRLVGQMVAPAVLPVVKLSCVEAVGSQMVKLGYEMTPWSVEVLTWYLKGYNIWLCGKPGVGKTFFFDTMNRYRASRDYESIRKLSMLETQGWTMDIAREWAMDNMAHDVLIDDVGTEPEMSSYGMKAELFPYLLEMRMGSDRRTHITSNLGAGDIKKRYGQRVSDRFVQFFKMLACADGKSRRKLQPWRTVKSGAGVI